jgi:signal peptidase II
LEVTAQFWRIRRGKVGIVVATKKTVNVCVFALCLIIDRITKCWALLNIAPAPAGQARSFLSFNLFLNRGVTFSLLARYEGLGLAVALVGLFFLGIVCVKNEKIRRTPGIALLWAGAVANLIDRIIYGHVIDWIRVWRGYMNVADMVLGVGCLLVCGYCLQNFRMEGKL